MPTNNDYVFVTHWRVEASIEDVSAILDDAADLPRWWPDVYLDVRVVSPGDDRGVGRVVESGEPREVALRFSYRPGTGVVTSVT